MTSLDRALRSGLKLRHLQLLVALDEFRHLGRAADFLSVTQPAVSKTLMEIERSFELPLFIRSTRGTEPTPSGEAVVRFARSVLSEYARTREEIACVAAGSAGRVSIGAMVVAMPALVVPAVRKLKERSALTTVLMEEGDLTRLLPRLRQGELDVVVGRMEPAYAAPDLETRSLRPESMCIVAHRAHRLARQRRRPAWSTLAAEKWVMPPPWASSRVKLLQQFYVHGLEPPRDIVETASFLVTLSSVRELSRIGFVATCVADAFADEGLVKLPIAVPMDLPELGLFSVRGRYRTAAVEQFIACLHEAAQ